MMEDKKKEREEERQKQVLSEKEVSSINMYIHHRVPYIHVGLVYDCVL